MHIVEKKPISYSLLLRDHGFHAFLWTQFLAAFNDNLYKMIVSIGAVDFTASQTFGARYLAISGAVFVLPFMLFAGYAGQLADRCSKTRVLQWTKAFEIVTMIAGAWALYAHSVNSLLFILFLLALQATLFSPAKYGIVPEMLGESAISRANGLLEFSTFAAIVLGSGAGSFLFAKWSYRPLVVGGALILIAIAGSFSSLLIRHVPGPTARSAFHANPFTGLWRTSKEIIRSRSLFLIIAGNSYFWFAGALVQLAVLLLGQEALHFSTAQTALLITALAAGIGTGSMAAGSLSGSQIELGLVPLGALLLSGFSILVGTAHSFAFCSFGLTGAGFAGGLFIVPLNAWLQHAANPGEKGRLLAANGFWNAFAMVFASALLWILHDVLHATAPRIFILLGVITLLVSVVAFRLLAAQALRLCTSWIVRLFFRINVVGAENLPKNGGALIVSNHVSYVDAVLIACISGHLIRFLMFAPLYRNPLLNPVCRLFRTIPLRQDSPRDAVSALHCARTALISGDTVGIFPEGRLTGSGHVQTFERGVEVIVNNLDAIPIVPVYIEGLWGHPFSRKDGQSFRSLPALRHPVTMVIGEPLFGADAGEMRARILELGTRAAVEHRASDATLALQFVRRAKLNWSAPAIADSTGEEMTYGEALVKARLIARTMTEQAIGILAPASVDGAIVNLAAALAGKTAVNLNFTAGTDHLRQALAMSGVTTIFASRGLARKFDLSAVARVVLIDDLLSGFTAAEERLTSLICRLLPARRVACRTTADSLAAIVFSSGSTGTPKGVMLSHWNLIANTGAAAAVFPIRPGDCVLGVLPFFHSLGYAYTIWFPLLYGYRAVYHSNPLDAKVIGELAASNKAAFFLSTPTFCLAYLRHCKRDQFSTIRCFVVGAEKLRSSVAGAFEEKFGIRLLEGYGCTEMGPVVSVNTPQASEPGTTGRLLPNVSARIVDPETFEEVKHGKTGLLLVNGPGRMLGYFKDPTRTAQAIRDGYYDTGDLAFIDGRGFLHIVDRLARFSKIAGEMVPHGKIEDTLAERAGIGRVAVTSMAGDRRGECIVVLYADPDITPEEMIAHLRRAGLPALWIPKRDSFIRVEAIPMLGSGKIDLVRVREIATRHEMVEA